MIEENTVITKKKSKQGVYKDPEKRKEYKRNYARKTALAKLVQPVVQPIVQPVVQPVVQLSVEENQAFLCIQFHKLRKFRKKYGLKDDIRWIEFLQKYEDVENGYNLDVDNEQYRKQNLPKAIMFNMSLG